LIRKDAPRVNVPRTKKMETQTETAATTSSAAAPAAAAAPKMSMVELRAAFEQYDKYQAEQVALDKRKQELAQLSSATVQNIYNSFGLGVVVGVIVVYNGHSLAVK
jgi:hypothetical protein